MTLTELWEKANRPRPPFNYCFDHPDQDREQVFPVDKVIMLEHETHFRDNGGDFKGTGIHARWIEFEGRKVFA